MVVLFTANHGHFIRVTSSVYFVIIAGVLLFSLGGHLATLKLKTPRMWRGIQRPPNRQMINIIFWLTIVVLPTFVLSILVFVDIGPYRNLFQNLRYYRAGGTIVTPLVMYFVTISYVSMGLQMVIGLGNRKKTKMWVAMAVSLAYSVLATGRSFLFLFMTVILGILLIVRKIPVKRMLVVFAFMGLAIFILVGIYQHNLVSADQDFVASRDFFLESFRVYSLGTIPALDQALRAKAELQYGANTFRSVLAAVNRIGFRVDVPPLVQEYAYVPYPINVYTVFHPYYRDFGYAGIAVAMLLIGYVHGMVYRKAATGRSFYVVIYAMLLFPLFMQFFQDQYFTLLATWVLVILVMKIAFFGKKT